MKPPTLREISVGPVIDGTHAAVVGNLLRLAPEGGVYPGTDAALKVHVILAEVREGTLMGIELCRRCNAPVVVGRVHCSPCGECYKASSMFVPVIGNAIDEASIKSFPASDPPGW